MNLSPRERRLLIVLGVVLVVMVAVFVVGRLGGGGSAAEVPDIVFPTESPSVAVVVPSTSPVFVVPPGARDPFKP